MRRKPRTDPNKISEYETKIDQADGVITKAWTLLVKHWGKLLIFVLLYGCYKFVVLVVNEIDKPTQEEIITIEDEFVSDPFVVREYEEEYDDGTTAVIQVWNDSTESVKN